MAIRLSASARNAMADAAVDRLDLGPAAATIKIYGGSRPADPDASTAETALATFTCNDPAFGSAASGVATLAGLPLSDTADATGTATWFRMSQSGGAGEIDGTVSASGGGGDLILNTVSITSGVTVEITAGTITMPQGA